MKLKNIPKSNRSQKKSLKKGPDVLTNSELLAILLGNDTKGTNVKFLSQKILKKFGKNLINVSVNDLIEIQGIGRTKALQISSAFTLAQRCLDEKTLSCNSLNANQVHTYDKNTSKENERKNNKFKFIDLFAGIGGFHIAFHNVGAECVFVSEWDSPAQKTYKHNFYKLSPEVFDSGNFVGDITKIDPKHIPDFDILTGGFPCQPFSQAGFKKGFSETRGTLFFDIAKIIKEKKPAAFFLENVRHLFKHDNGKTFETIKRIITEELGYSFFPKIVKASDFGMPQHRPRLFMVGFRNKEIDFKFPEPFKELKYNMSDIFGGSCDKEIGYTLRVGGRGSKITDRRNWDSYRVNGKVVRLGPKEGLKMQGFPDWFEFPSDLSEVQAMKQLGNSVAVPAIQAVAAEIIKTLNKYENRK